MKKMSTAQAIVEVLKQCEVEKVFCVPGESYLHVLDALYETPEISLISGRHEGGVSFMAEAYAKASGNVGVCFATRGPGATNLSIGLHTAHQDSTPLVAFIGQVERKNRGREGFQEIDLAEHYSHIVKWSIELNDSSRVGEVVQRAFHIAKTGRPGPVLISLPQDILSEETELHVKSTGSYSFPRPEKKAIEQTKELLLNAKRPVIIAGGGVISRGAVNKLIELAEELAIPVTTAFRRFDAFPNDNKYYVGPLGMGTPQYLKDLVYQADVVLAIGTRFSQITTNNYSLLSPTSQLIHVDISGEEINKVYPAEVGIVADCRSFLLDLLTELQQNNSFRDFTHRYDYVLQSRNKFEKWSAPSGKKKVHSIENNKVDLEAVIADLQWAVPDKTIITTDAGNFFGWLSRYFQFNKGSRYIGPTSGAMGYGLPAALGAKLALPDHCVVSISGDGGFMMTVQELETAVRYQIPVIAIVVNNNMYGTIRMHQESNFPDRVYGTELNNPNFAELAKLMGGNGELIEKNEDFIPALQRAISAEKPTVLEVRINQENISVSATIAELQFKSKQ